MSARSRIRSTRTTPASRHSRARSPRCTWGRVRWRSPRCARSARARRLVELADERVDAPRDVVARGANLVERPALRVLEVPVDVALARDVRALVAAAHGHHDVGALGELARQLLRDAIGEVDAELAHDLDDLGMDA